MDGLEDYTMPDNQSGNPNLEKKKIEILKKLKLHELMMKATFNPHLSLLNDSY